MAELLNRIPTNLTEYPNSFKRQGAFPLEAYSVFYTMADAEAYASTNAVSYVGQTLAVVTANAEDASVVDSVTLYIIADAAGTLQEVGRATSGDGNSIVLDENGVLSLAGFAAAASATLPQKQADGTIKWVAIDAIVEGDGNTKSVVLSDDTKVTVTPEYTEDGDTYTYKIKLDLSAYYTAEEVDDAIAEAIGTAATEDAEATGIHAAIAEAEARAKAYADANDTDTVYDDTALKARVKTIEDDYLKAADKYDDTALANRVKALEDEERYDETALADRVTAVEEAINDETTGLEARVSAMETFWETTEDADDVVNKLKEIQDYIASDETGAATMAGNIQTNTEAIATLNGDGAGSVNKKIADAIDPLATKEALEAVKATAEAAQTADEVSDAIDAKIAEENLGQYAKTADVEAAYAKIADVVDNDTFETFKTTNDQAIAAARTGAVADVEAKGYAKANEVASTYATKEELTAHINTAEGTYAKIADVYTSEEVDSMIAGINQGNQESASAVNTKLTNYITSNDKEIENLKAKDTELTTAVENAQTQADKGVTDAAAAAKAVSDLAAGQVTTNKNDIDAVKGRLTTLEAAKGDHETRIATAEGKINTLETTVDKNSKAIGQLQGNITALNAEDARLDGLITALNSNKANAADVYSKTDTEQKIKDAIDAIPAVDLTPYATTESVTSAVNDINAELIKKADATNVYTKTEADAAFMTETEVADKINALINAADPEGGKTIENIQNLVKYVDDNAGEIATLITNVATNTEAIAANATAISDMDASIVALNDAISKMIQPKASAEISVGTDGTLGIKELNVNKLTQTEGDTLVLNGGKA